MRIDTRPARRLGTLLLVLGPLLSALMAPPPAAAQTPTLKTINVDGNLSDWDEVLLNPLQVTLDADGSTIPCNFSTDRDCPVQSNGRDLRVFAWTYDATYLYYYVQRQGSASNVQNFWFYMDLDLDQKMGFGDMVLRVSYQGSTGVTQNDLFRYVPDLPSGDPLVDAGGFGDGYSLPGNLNATAVWTEAVPNGGSADGYAFEERLPWSAMGIAPGTGLYFHVTSSNSGNPTNIASQADDDLGGPTGGAGSLGFDLVEVVPDRRGTVVPGSSVSYSHVVTNRGARPQSFDLRVSSTLGLSVSAWDDPDADGVGDVLLGTDANGDGDFVDAGDFLEASRDANLNGYPQTPVLAMGVSRSIVVTLQTLPAQDGLQDVTTVTAWLAGAVPPVQDAVTDVTDIGAVTILADPTAKNTVAGQNVAYAFEVCNNGPSDTVDLTVASVQGYQVSLFSDPECDGVPNDFLAQDRTGNGSWDTLISGDSDGDGDPDTGPLAPGSCSCFVVQVRVPGNASPPLVETTTVTAQGSGQPTQDEQALTTSVTDRIEAFPGYTFAAGTQKVSGAGRPVYFAHTARNNWLVADRITFAPVPPTNSLGWTVRVWSDPNGDGNIFDGSVITQTDPIPPNGGETHFVVEVQVPAGVPQGTRSTTLVTAAAALDTTVRVVLTDEVEVSSIATYSDDLFRIATTFFPPCVTIHVQGTGLLRPGGAFRDVYDLVYFDANGRNVRFHDPFVPDVNGEATDQYVMQPGDPPGEWRVELRENTLTIATVLVTVEANGVVDPLATGRPSYPMTGSALDVLSTLTNGNRVAVLDGTTVEYVVLDPTGAEYLVSGASSVFAPYGGVESTRTSPVPALDPTQAVADPFTVTDVTYPREGVYTLRATWRASCGVVLESRSAAFVVGAGEDDCTNAFDDDGDGLVDCDDPECGLDPACVESPCDDGRDNDGDGLTDCEDPDCATAPPCVPEDDCTNQVDDDGDGRTDCDDLDCATDPACPETDCSDGTDGDGDTLVDCQDPDCAADPACIESPCTDGLDNDGDTAADCDDFDCALDPSCLPELNCTDAQDNDGDGLVDCEDDDCDGSPGCTPETQCRDTLDNDGDGLVDCDDDDCAGDPSCVPETECTDTVDNDADTLVDCEDSDCAGDPACVPETECTDTLDNDGDGLVDCDDDDCAGDPACVPETECTDTLDNDGDTLVDCQDSDCAGAPPCQGTDGDGDTFPDPLDCAPADPTAWSLPGEVLRLDVTTPSGGPLTDAVLSWTAPVPPGGTIRVYDVVSGRLSELWADRGFTRAACLANDLAAPGSTDSRLTGTAGDGWYYLVRAENVCGMGPWGDQSDGAARVVDPLLCD